MKKFQDVISMNEHYDFIRIQKKIILIAVLCKTCNVMFGVCWKVLL